MRRLFSSFARGAPGIGLLLLRLTIGSALIYCNAAGLLGGAPLKSMVLHVLMGLLGSMLLVGLWTPVAGALVAMVAIWQMATHLMSWPPLVSIAVIAAALALLGPGAWSIDARLYGWKQIRIPARRQEQDLPD